MDLQGVHHVAIIVSDYQISRRFYVELLSLPVLRENYRKERDSYKLDLKLGDGELELFSFPGSPPRASYPEACGLRHLAFSVPDLSKAVDELNQKGIETEPIRTDDYTGKRLTFFRDPDGLPLELQER